MKGFQAFIWVIIIVIVAALIYFFVGMQKADISTYSSSKDKGRAVFVITDAAANMNSVSSVKMTVDSVQVHSASQGWVTVSSSSKTYDLLELKSEGKQALIVDSQLKADTYDQMKLGVSKVVVVSSQGEQEAKLPSNELKIQDDFKVDSNSTTTATFDFVADESLHVTGNGKYIMAPVINVETRENAQVDAESEDDVKITSGTVKTNIKVGTDINGNVGVGLKIPTTSNLSLTSNGRLSLGL